MKYLTTTFAVALVAFGFASIMTTPAQANESWECAQNGGIWSEGQGHDGMCNYGNHPGNNTAEIDDVEPLQQVAINDDDRLEDCLTRENPDGMQLCVVTDDNGNERVAGIEVPEGVEFAYATTVPGCVWNQEKHRYDCPWQPKAGETEGEQVAFDATKCWLRQDGSVECEDPNLIGLPKAGEAEGEQVAWDSWSESNKCWWEITPSTDTGADTECTPTKTPTGTFYPLPMMTVAETDKLLAPGGISVASFDKILAPGGTAVESKHQFADREDGSGGDLGESGGGDFGEGDRAAASTAAE